MFNTTFNTISVISWRSVLLVGETGIPGENHRPVASHWQSLSHNVVLSTPRHDITNEETQLYALCIFNNNDCISIYLIYYCDETSTQRNNLGIYTISLLNITTFHITDNTQCQNSMLFDARLLLHCIIVYLYTLSRSLNFWPVFKYVFIQSEVNDFPVLIVQNPFKVFCL